MPSPDLHELGAFEGHAPGQERALTGYAAVITVFTSVCAAFAAWVRRSGRDLPERIGAGDLVLFSIATHKAARLIAKDRVASVVRAPFTRFEEDAGPSEVSESARGRGVRRAIGELLVCPYCLGMWIAAAFIGGFVAAPRPTRLVAALFTTVTGSDALQIAYKKAEDTL